MPIFNSPQAQAVADNKFISQHLKNAVVKATTATWTVPAGVAIGDEVELCSIPNAAYILPNSMFIYEAMGAGVTVSIGTRAYTRKDGVAVADSATSLFTAQSTATAGNAQFNTNKYANYIDAGVTDSPNEIKVYAKIGGAVPTVGSKMALNLFHTAMN